MIFPDVAFLIANYLKKQRAIGDMFAQLGGKKV